MTPKQRYQFSIDDSHWLQLDDDSAWLHRAFMRLLDEWGTFLDINLFYEAIVHFLGGEEKAIREIEVVDGERVLGKQKVHLLNSDITFKISSITKDDGHFEDHFRRFIRYTKLKAIHWINFNHDKVEFKTILK